MALAVFLVGALICLGGALGVVLSRNPVHSALSLVGTLFGIAVLFVSLDAEFLAAVQVIVYAGAIVVMFLFVIMLLGVDTAEDLEVDPLGGGQRLAAILAAIVVVGGLAVIIYAGAITGAHGNAATLASDLPNVELLAQALFTRYVWAFEITSVLLVIAVVGAVSLARHRHDALVDDPADELAEEVDA